MVNGKLPTRDESRDVWVWRNAIKELTCISMAQRQLFNGCLTPRCDAGERYVPYSQLEAALAQQAHNFTTRESDVSIDRTPPGDQHISEKAAAAKQRIEHWYRDSDLLDAILEAYSCSEYEFSVAIKSAIEERAKR